MRASGRQKLEPEDGFCHLGMCSVMVFYNSTHFTDTQYAVFSAVQVVVYLPRVL